jgi:hypothetical protein
MLAVTGRTFALFREGLGKIHPVPRQQQSTETKTTTTMMILPTNLMAGRFFACTMMIQIGSRGISFRGVRISHGVCLQFKNRWKIAVRVVLGDIADCPLPCTIAVTATVVNLRTTNQWREMKAVQRLPTKSTVSIGQLVI